MVGNLVVLTSIMVLVDAGAFSDCLPTLKYSNGFCATERRSPSTAFQHLSLAKYYSGGRQHCTETGMSTKKMTDPRKGISLFESLKCSVFTFDAEHERNGPARQIAKQRLLKLVGEIKLEGRQPQPDDNTAVIAAVEELERLNPCPCPVESPLLSGKWSLLYTGAADTAIILDRRSKEGLIGATVTEVSGASDTIGAPAGAGGEPLGRRITTLAGRLVRNRGNYQDIEAEAGRVVNRAALELVGVPLELRIEGRCRRDAVDAADPARRAARLRVSFERFSLALGAGPSPHT